MVINLRLRECHHLNVGPYVRTLTTHYHPTGTCHVFPTPQIMLHNISHPSNSRKIQATCYYILLHKYKPRVPHYMSILNQNNFAFYTWRSCLPKQPRKINHTNQPITFSDLSHLIYFNSS